MRHLVRLAGFAALTMAFLPFPASGNEYSFKALKEDVEAAESAAALRAVFREYVEQAADVDVAKSAQDQWKALDVRGAKAHAESLYQAKPESARWLYFRARFTSTPLEQIEAGRRLVALQPDAPWGYRLIVAAYDGHLFTERMEQPFRDTLAVLVPGDLRYFHRFRELEPTSSLAHTALFDYYAYVAQWDSAQALFDVARYGGSAWADESRELTLAAAHGRFEEVLGKTSADVDTLIARGQLESKEREHVVRRLYTGILRNAKAWDELVSYLKSLPDGSTDMGILYDLACYSALAHKTDEAFGYLEAALDAGWDDLHHMQSDPDLASIRGVPRWNELAARLDGAGASPDGGALSYADTLARPAPDWVLTDVHGDTVRLVDLRGSVVVLDFFATWCGPCRMAMPALSRYVRDEMPEGVRVFSINVMETPFAKAQLLWESEGYGMTLLKGNDAIAASYGFEGIPYICAVDKKGMIRIAYPGYGEGLEDDLARQVVRLLQES